MCFQWQEWLIWYKLLNKAKAQNKNKAREMAESELTAETQFGICCHVSGIPGIQHKLDILTWNEGNVYFCAFVVPWHT